MSSLPFLLKKIDIDEHLFCARGALHSSGLPKPTLQERIGVERTHQRVLASQPYIQRFVRSLYVGDDAMVSALREPLRTCERQSGVKYASIQSGSIAGTVARPL
jgi:hypothetical protein